jgi:glycerol-3-phosphate dehydrogenase (NAD(P)+)
MMKIAYLGAGVWGFALAKLLADKGYEVLTWCRDPSFVETLNKNKEHPKLPGIQASGNLRFTNDMGEALESADLIIESVSSSGIRDVFREVKRLGHTNTPIVITSKGIEQNTGLILSEVVIQEIGEDKRQLLGYLSGPSYAAEVVKGLPTGVVCTAYEHSVMMKIAEAFNTPRFRVYPNSDLIGVAMAGALKNVIAIACGSVDGLGFGVSSKSALMTRGLHEISKLAIKKGCKPKTLYGLAGMGDLCLTCSSPLSRNYRFGTLLAQGKSVEEAKAQIGMVVEGAYTCVSALQISRQENVEMPITEAVYNVIYENMSPHDAVLSLMQRAVKEEHL